MANTGNTHTSINNTVEKLNQWWLHPLILSMTSLMTREIGQNPSKNRSHFILSSIHLCVLCGKGNSIVWNRIIFLDKNSIYKMDFELIFQIGVYNIEYQGRNIEILRLLEF